MAIPPQFLKKSKAHAAEDAKDGGKDNAKEDSNGNLKKPAHKGAPKKDSKDPKGAKFDAIPNGPFKGANPNNVNNAKRNILLQQARGGK